MQTLSNHNGWPYPTESTLSYNWFTNQKGAIQNIKQEKSNYIQKLIRALNVYWKIGQHQQKMLRTVKNITFFYA
jgi:hypothetical protein